MRAQSSTAGFSLIEVLVALIIIGVGMLGIAKLQGMAYASTGTASLRSLAAIEAASLAASMRANRAYWTAAPATGMPAAGITFTVTGGATPGIVMSDGNVNATTPACGSGYSGSPCTSFQIAGYDLNAWAGAINAVLPSVTALVSCAPPPVLNTVVQPIGCTIQLNWTENQTGINSQSQGNSVATAAGATAPTNYTLYVEP